jgi:hypothetical protein
VRVIAASIRPWRYVFSESFRERTHQQFIGKNLFIKVWFLLWGGIAVLASLAIIAAIIWLLISWYQAPKPEPDTKQKAIENIENLILEQVKKRKERSP